MGDKQELGDKEQVLGGMELDDMEQVLGGMELVYMLELDGMELA